MAKVSWWYTEFGATEKSQVLSAFENHRFTLGPVTAELEGKIASFLEVPYVVAAPSGTAALTMALMACGVEQGDEVIVPDLTWIATAQAAWILGAKVVPVDCLPDVPLMDPAEVKKKISLRTRAVIPVHLNGRACDLEELGRIARKAGVVLVEDACKALGTRTPRGCLGTIGETGCFSLGMVSLLSAGYGGAVATRDRELYGRLKLIRNHGVARDGGNDYVERGFNFRFSDLLAAIGNGQFGRLGERIEHVRTVYRRYSQGLSRLRHVRILPVGVDSGEVPLCTEIRSIRRDELLGYLARHDVEAMKFHRPVHLAPYLQARGDFPNASAFSEEGLILPCGPSQSLENVDRCIDLIRQWDSAISPP